MINPEDLKFDILFKEREIVLVTDLLQQTEKRLLRLQHELYLLEKQLQELKCDT